MSKQYKLIHKLAEEPSEGTYKILLLFAGAGIGINKLDLMVQNSKYLKIEVTAIEYDLKTADAYKILNPNTTRIEYVDWNINPFVGCAHACSYCYARLIDLRFKKVASRAEWHRPKLVENYMDLIEKKIHLVGNDEEIFISTMTDVVSSDIHNQKVLRNIVIRLQDANLKYRILTKSPNIVKDKEYLHYKKGLVGLSITTDINNRTGIKKWEPRTKSIFKRFEAIETLSKEKTIPIWISAEPFLPGTNFKNYIRDIELFSKESLMEIVFGKMNYVKNIDDLFDWKNAVYYFEKFKQENPNIKVHYKSQFSDFLEKHFSELTPYGGYT